MQRTKDRTERLHLVLSGLARNERHVRRLACAINRDRRVHRRLQRAESRMAITRPRPVKQMTIRSKAASNATLTPHQHPSDAAPSRLSTGS